MYMTGWLIFFCALIAIAILLQAGALLGMFMQVRRVSAGLDELKTQVSARLNSLSAELQQQTHALGDKANQTADLIKAEVMRVEGDIAEVRASAQEAIQMVNDIRQKMHDAMQRLIYLVNTPSREATALSKGVQTGLRVLFSSDPRAQQYKRSA